MPLILVTNDDGVRSDGIDALARAMAAVGDVIVCAPSRQQSAVSHAISLGTPLRLREVAPRRFAVTGTPADATFIALTQVCPRKPDLLVSGINHGLNMGTDVLYSGTVAAAVEGTVRGIPAIAVSQQLPAEVVRMPADAETAEKIATWHPPGPVREKMRDELEHTAAFAAELASAVLARPLGEGVTLNVNAPHGRSRRYAWTRLGRRTFEVGPGSVEGPPSLEVRSVDPTRVVLSLHRVKDRPEEARAPAARGAE